MKSIRPAAPLDALVEMIWLLPSSPCAPGAPHELALPTGTVELVINLDDDRISVFGAADLREATYFTGAVLCGPHSSPFGLDGGRRRKTLGVHFKPGGASALLPVALHELENSHLLLEDVLGDDARLLRDELGRVSGSDRLLLSTMESFLLRWAGRALHPAVVAALRHLDTEGHRPDVRTLVNGSGLSHRRFNELFRATVGLGAKRYSRIARFQHALCLLERHPPVDWLDLVNECEFYDQAHLIHEFKKHSGLTPSEYLGRRGERFNHPLASSDIL